jgi:hypothetical protein
MGIWVKTLKFLIFIKFTTLIINTSYYIFVLLIYLKLKLIFFWILVLLSLNASGQCLLAPMPLEEWIKSADIIVEGEIIFQSCRRTSDKARIETHQTIRIYRIFKGDLAKEITMITQGGYLDNTLEEVTPEVKLQIGDKGIFGMTKKKFHFEPLAFAHCFFKYDYDNLSANGVFTRYSLHRDELAHKIEDTEQSKAIRIRAEDLISVKNHSSSRRAIGTITSFSPTSERAGIKKILTINGSGFGTNKGLVYFSNANGNTAYDTVRNHQIVSWSDVSIMVEIPRFAGIGLFYVKTTANEDIYASSAITIPSAHSSVENSSGSYLNKHASFSQTQDHILFRPHHSFIANTNAVQSFNTVLSSWACAMGVRWEQSTTPTDSITPRNDGIDFIAFDSLGPSVLGVTYRTSVGCFINNKIAFSNTSLDIKFNSKINWNFTSSPPSGGNFDFQSVAVHELGHALLLGHVNDASKAMYRSIGPNQSKRNITNIEASEAGDSYLRSTSSNEFCSNLYPLSYVNHPNRMVTNTSASGSGSLSQALTATCFNDTVDFSLPPVSTFMLNQELNISKNIYLKGLSQEDFIFSGNNTNRIFSIQPNVSLTIENLKLINGYSPTDGGAIFNQGKLILKDVTLSNNKEGPVNKALTNTNNAILEILGNVIIKP